MPVPSAPAGQDGDQVLVLLPQVVLNGGGHDEVVALQGGPGEAVPLVHRGEGGDGGFGALRLGNARRAEGVVKDAGVEDEGEAITAAVFGSWADSPSTYTARATNWARSLRWGGA